MSIRALRAWLIRLVATFRPGRRDRDLRDELASHIELHIDDCVARGMSLAEAQRDARLRLGGLAQTEELIRERTRLGWLDSALADVRFALRLLRKNPGFAAVAIVTLALGIGATTSIFSVANAVLWTPLPYPRGSELVVVSEGAAGDGAGTTSFATWTDWRARTAALDELVLVRGWSPVLAIRGADAEPLPGARVGADLFRTLGIQPALGRDFAADEDTAATRRVAILSDSLWRRRFGGDPAIVGRAISIDAERFTVIGVLGPQFDPVVAEAMLGVRAEIWAPLGYEAAQPWACRTCRHVHALGRLAPGVSAAAAEAELEQITRSLSKQYPDDYAGPEVTVRPLDRHLVADARPVLHLLLGAVALVLLIACVNVALLLLARAGGREREIAVRMAVGAPRSRVIRQLLIENCVLAVIGAAAGLLPAAFLPEAIAHFGPRFVPRLAEVELDHTVLLFALAITVATGILSGLAPALRLTAAGASAPRHGQRTVTASAGVRRLRRLFVIAQIALSLTLLTAAGLMVRTLVGLLDVAPGFDSQRVVTMSAGLVGPRTEDEAAVRRHWDTLLSRVSAVVGVDSAAIASQIPLGGNFDSVGFHPEDRLATHPEQDPSAQRFAISPDYLRTLDIPLIRGRALRPDDVAGRPPVILVNRTAAERVWPGQDPIGKRVKVGGMDGPWWTVVGVVGDVRHLGLDEAPEMQLYLPIGQWTPTQVIVAVRTQVSSATVERAIVAAARSVDPAQPIAEVTWFDDLVLGSVAGRRLALAMLAALAAAALVLSAIGIYGVNAYTVAQRTHEIGIRLALGARPGNVVAAILRETMVLTLAGIALGVAGALAVTPIMASLLYGVSASDPVTFAAVTAVIVASSLAASYLPARRATRIEPTEALRTDAG